MKNCYQIVDTDNGNEIFTKSGLNLLPFTPTPQQEKIILQQAKGVYIQHYNYYYSDNDVEESVSETTSTVDADYIVHQGNLVGLFMQTAGKNFNADFILSRYQKVFPSATLYESRFNYGTTRLGIDKFTLVEPNTIEYVQPDTSHLQQYREVAVKDVGTYYVQVDFSLTQFLQYLVKQITGEDMLDGYARFTRDRWHYNQSNSQSKVSWLNSHKDGETEFIVQTPTAVQQYVNYSIRPTICDTLLRNYAHYGNVYLKGKGKLA
ncbi:MAG: hypothetical protein IKC47_00420 [Clostridia bacterium]|nr:hypothetical protein [Clostridia bacterium]